LRGLLGFSPEWHKTQVQTHPLSDSGRCWNPHLSGESCSSLPGVPKYSWRKAGKEGLPSLAEADCWAPESAAVNTKQLSAWGLAWPWSLGFPQSFAGACWSGHSPGG